MQCFQKDPNLRVTARKLLRHAWITGCRRTEAPVSKTPANFSDAVEEVKQWNKALKSSGPRLRQSTGSDAGPSSRFLGGTPAKGGLSLAKLRPGAGAFSKPELAGALKSRYLSILPNPDRITDDDNWDDDFATAISPSALQLPHLKPQDNFGGLLSSDRLKAFASVNDGRNDSNSYDDDFEGELMTIKGPGHWQDIDPQEQTIRPLPKKPTKSSEPAKTHSRNKSSSSKVAGAGRTRSPTKSNLNTKFELPPRPDIIYREQSMEDFSDLFVDNDNVFTHNANQAVRRVSYMCLHPMRSKLTYLQNSRQTDAPQLFHPSDLTSLPRSMQESSSGSMKKKPLSRPSVLPDRPMRRTRSSIEIQKFAEDDDEDFSDVFGPESSIAEKEESEKGSEDGGLMLMSRVSSNSWLGDDEDEDDPFASMDPGWDEMDLEANIARDRHARLAERVEDLVRSLKTTEGEDALAEFSEDLVSSCCPSRTGPIC